MMFKIIKQIVPTENEMNEVQKGDLVYSDSLELTDVWIGISIPTRTPMI